MKRHLLNISNHPSSRWEEGQKAGWDTIVDVPFPQIHPSWDTTHEGWINAVGTILTAIDKACREAEKSHSRLFVFIAGEFSVCYEVVRTLHDKIVEKEFSLVVPTTRREVVETIKEDGTVEKRAVFKFVQWRALP